VRILFITRSWPVTGGTEIWLDSLHEGLLALGIDVQVALAEGAVHNRSEPFFRASQSIKKAWVINGTSGSARGRHYHIVKLLRHLKPDIVLPLRVYDALMVCSRLKKELGFRLLYALHEYRPSYFEDLRQFGPFLDRVVVCDILSARAVQEVSSIAKSIITVIPQGISLPDFRHARTFNLPLRLGYCGRFENLHKRHLDLIGICEELTRRSVPFNLRIVGRGPDEAPLRRGLAHLIEKGVVRFDEWSSPTALREDFYPNIDAFIVTSSRETGPLVAWEAMAAGAVLITSRYRGLEAAGFLDHGKNCLIFDVGDIGQAADRIEALIQNPDIAMPLTYQAAQGIAATRAIKRVAQEWEKQFQSVLAVPAALGQEHQLPPPPVGGGRLERTGLPIGLIEGVKQLLGYRFLHRYPGEEWPIAANYSYEIDDTSVLSFKG